MVPRGLETAGVIRAGWPDDAESEFVLSDLYVSAMGFNVYFANSSGVVFGRLFVWETA